mgnify:CR=1 FL=1
MINLFEFDNHIIDTSTFDHHLHGAIVREFEERVCDYVGAKYAASFFSASYALYAIMKSKVCQTPNKIVIPSMIPPVVPNVLADSGVKVSFNCDIDWVGSSYRLCPGVIDSAQQLDKNQYRDNQSDDDLMVFSLYPTKPLSSLDGGIIVSNNKDMIDDLKSLSFYGMQYSEDSWSRVQKQVGYKAYMSTMQATIASRNLDNLDEKYEKLDGIRESYNESFGLCNTSRHLYRISVDNNNDALKYFKSKGIACGIHYTPQHSNPVFAEQLERDSSLYNDVTLAASRTLSIPFHHKLKQEQVNYIIKEVMNFNNG